MYFDSLEEIGAMIWKKAHHRHQSGWDRKSFRLFSIKSVIIIVEGLFGQRFLAFKRKKKQRKYESLGDKL